MPKKKYTKLGVVWEGEYGPYVRLGESKSKNEQYNFEVQIMVKNSKGEKVALVKNPVLSLFDPRKNEKRAGNVPEKLKYELMLAEELKDE